MNVPLSAIVAVSAVMVLGLVALVGRSLWSSGGDAPYSIQAAIAEPTRENRLLPDQVPCPRNGRLAEGQNDGPLPNTHFAPTGGRPLDGLFAPGQVVAFEFLVEASDAARSGGSLDFEVSWPRAGQRNGGFDAERKVVCAFVDTSDPSTRETEGGEAVARFTDLPAPQDELRASFALQGLEPGGRVVVEVWLAAPVAVPEGSGTVQTRIGEATADGGRDVEVERKVIDYRMSFFDRREDPTLTLDVNDSQPTGPERAQRIDYIVVLRNTAQTAIAPAARFDAFLDKQTKLSSVEPADKEGSTTTCAPVAEPAGFTCNLGFMNPGEEVTVRASVAIQPGAEKRWTKEEPGCTGAEVLVDVCGQFVLTWKQTASDDGEVRVEQPSDLPADQALSISKLVPVAPYAYPGQKVIFTYRVSNAGASGSFNQLRLSDNTCREITGPKADPNNNQRLDPGESWDYSCTIEQIGQDQYTSESKVEAIADDARPVVASVITKITPINPKLAVTMVKQGDNPGVRAITVASSGDANLENLTVAAPACGPVAQASNGDGDQRLAPGESWTFTCSADPSAQVTARAYATDPLGGAVTAAATS